MIKVRVKDSSYSNGHKQSRETDAVSVGPLCPQLQHSALGHSSEREKKF